MTSKRAKPHHDEQPPAAAGELEAAPAETPLEKSTSDPVLEVAAWLLEGASRQDILEALHALFGLHNPDQVIADAYAHLAERVSSSEHRRAWHVEARRELFRRSVEIADYKTAHQVLRELAALEGLVGAHKARDLAHGTPQPDQVDQTFDEAFGIPTIQ